MSTCAINPWTRGKRICCRTPERRCTWSAKRIWIPLSWKPWRTSRSPTTGLNSQWWNCRRMKRPQLTSKNWISSWQWKSSRIRQQFYRKETFAMNTDTHISGSTVKNHISLQNGIRIQCKTKIHVPVVVPGLSASSSSSLLPQHPWHLQGRKLIVLPHHPWHLQLCQAKVWLDNNGETCGIDHHPAIVSSERVERQERWDPCTSEISEEQLLTKPTKNQRKIKTTIKNGDTRAIPKYRNGCKNSKRILCLTEFLNTETHMQVLHMDHH